MKVIGRRIKFRLSTLLFVVIASALLFGIYASQFGPGDVSIRTASGKTLIANDDILSVDWENQKYELRSGLKGELIERLRAEGGLIGGVPFQLCVDDDPILNGRWTSALSSFGFTEVAIVIDSGETDTIKIQLGYPARATPRKRRNDPRFRHRIYSSLWFDGKLE